MIEMTSTGFWVHCGAEAVHVKPDTAQLSPAALTREVLRRSFSRLQLPAPRFKSLSRPSAASSLYEMAHRAVHRNRPESANPGPPTPFSPARLHTAALSPPFRRSGFAVQTPRPRP